MFHRNAGGSRAAGGTRWEQTTCFRILALIVLGAILILTPCYGQVVVGQLPSRPDRGGAAVPSLGPRTLIDLSHPADGSATLTGATVAWDADVPCATAFDSRGF